MDFNKRKIKPEKITKPFQLLATWLLGLIILVGEFVFASLQIHKIGWLAVVYCFTAIGIIPLFLWLIFLLQTKYRPEMQEDKYYKDYLHFRLKEDRVAYKKIKEED